MARQLQAVARFAPSRSVNPAMEGILVTVDEGSITYEAGDPEVGLSVVTREVAPQLSGSERQFILPARAAGVVSSLPRGQFISVETPGGAGKVTIRCGKSRYSFMGTDPLDFPRQVAGEEGEGLTITAEDLDTLTRATVPFAGKDVGRPVFTGIHWAPSACGEWLTAVATDSYRVSVCTVPARSDLPAGSSILIPPKVLQEISALKFSGCEVSVQVRPGRVLFNAKVVGETYTFRSALLDGSFPDVGKVIPDDNPTRAAMQREDILSALNRLVMVTDSERSIVRVQVTGDGMSISVESNAGDAAEDIFTTWVECGEDVDVYFNGKYLVDAVKNIPTGDISFAMGGRARNSPCTIRPCRDGEDVPGRVNFILPIKMD